MHTAHGDIFTTSLGGTAACRRRPADKEPQCHRNNLETTALVLVLSPLVDTTQKLLSSRSEAGPELQLRFVRPAELLHAHVKHADRTSCDNTERSEHMRLVLTQGLTRGPGKADPLENPKIRGPNHAQQALTIQPNPQLLR